MSELEKEEVFVLNEKQRKRKLKVKELMMVEYTWTIKAKNNKDAKRILKQGVYDNGDFLQLPTYREVKNETKLSYMIGDKNG